MTCFLILYKYIAYFKYQFLIPEDHFWKIFMRSLNFNSQIFIKSNNKNLKTQTLPVYIWWLVNYKWQQNWSYKGDWYPKLKSQFSNLDCFMPENNRRCGNVDPNLNSQILFLHSQNWSYKGAWYTKLKSQFSNLNCFIPENNRRCDNVDPNLNSQIIFLHSQNLS